MNEITHTTGPWRVVPIGNEHYVYDNSEEFIICDMMRNKRYDDLETYRSDANAVLIAAAPELLGALKEILDAHRAAHELGSHENRCFAINRAATVVAKAEGKL